MFDSRLEMAEERFINYTPITFFQKKKKDSMNLNVDHYYLTWIIEIIWDWKKTDRASESCVTIRKFNKHLFGGPEEKWEWVPQYLKN